MDEREKVITQIFPSTRENIKLACALTGSMVPEVIDEAISVYIAVVLKKQNIEILKDGKPLYEA